MADKNEKKSQNKNTDKQHVFEVHTMAKDNELMASQPATESEAHTSQAPQKSVDEKNAAKNKFKNGSKESNAANPFLQQDAPEGKDSAPTSSFAPQKRSEPVEKINYSPADIAPEEDKTQPKKQSNKVVHIAMIIFIIIFILGAIGLVLYLFVYDQNEMSTPVEEIEVTTPAEEEFVVPEQEPVVQTQVYATDLPNYFQIDVESETSESDIAAELDEITRNMDDEDIDGPISFIITDTNGNPVSFAIFALSAGINLPSDVLSSLEENFELYAYMDETHGVRFGLAIDTKNVNLLQEALRAQEAQLPGALSVLMNNASIEVNDVEFKDSSYNTNPIRYANLNDAESYSVDYTIHNLRLLIGTTKDTLRAIIENVRGGTYSPEEAISTGSDDATMDTPIEEGMRLDDEDSL